MSITVGVMGSAGDASPGGDKEALVAKANALANVIATRDLMLLTGATTGIVYVVGKFAHDAGIFHLEISLASNRR